MTLLRNIYHRLVLVPGVASSFRFAMRHSATIFMCHRFADRERGIEGLDPAALRSGLEYLRRHKHEFLSLDALFARLAEGPGLLRGAVAFTIDDGYVDHACVAAPLFAEFDCPVTTFVTTGFLDGSLWMWWDKVEYVFLGTQKTHLKIDLDGHVHAFDCSSAEARALAATTYVNRLKPMPHDEKLTAIGRLAGAAAVDLPAEPPERYRPMSWNDARRCEQRGMTFGPHTVTHPILTTIPPERSAWEITESWRRLSSEVRRPVRVFCYPNGESADFGDNEISVLQQGLFLGAVVGEWGFAERPSLKRTGEDRFRTKRLPYPERLSDLAQYVSGIERCKAYVRSRI